MFNIDNSTSAISVLVDSQDKELANSILKNLGLNMSTFVNMAIKQLIYKDAIPFEVSNPKPTKDLLEAINESNQILLDIRNGKRKSYDDVDKLITSLEEK